MSEQRVYQCPGCWSVSMNERPDSSAGYYECGCGEKLTLLDLREREGRGCLTIDAPEVVRRPAVWRSRDAA